MTDYIDKEKRKRRPSRRRLIVILITLILLCLAGGIVLTPQIDTWLATDPFTPQCHFEQDRLFATGEPFTIHSINEGIYGEIEVPIEATPPFVSIQWSPNGDRLAYDRLQDNYLYSVNDAVITPFNSLVNSLDVSDYRNPIWSPNGRYISFEAVIDDDKHMLYVYDFDTSTIISINDSSDYFSYVTWLSNSNYLYYVTGDVGFLFNFTTQHTTTLGNTSQEIRFNSSQSPTNLYFVKNEILYGIDTETEKTKLIKSLPASGLYFDSISPDENYFVFAKENHLWLLDKDRKKWSKFEGNRIQWLDNNQFMFFRQNSSSQTEILVWNPVSDSESNFTTIESNIKWFAIVPSPSRSYLRLYGIRDSNLWLFSIDAMKLVNLGNFPENSIFRWLQYQNQDLLVVKELIDNAIYRLYIFNPETKHRCKVGIVGETVIFQPQLAGDNTP